MAEPSYVVPLFGAHYKKRGIPMAYFNYHATAKRLISQGKLVDFYFTEKYKHISPALVLIFDDPIHPVMPIREHRWGEYLPLLTSPTP